MTAPHDTAAPFAAMAYGCRWRSAFPLSLFESDAGAGVWPEIRVTQRFDPLPERVFMRSKGAISLAEDGLRYRAEEATVLDSYGGGRVEVFPGSGGMDSLPAAFYGTVTAAVMTWRGGLAMHGSAVEMDGRGALLCGHSGAGKSTLTGALIAAGARLVSDDLSVLHTGPAGNDPVLFAGRRTLRLFPDVADRLGKAVAVKEVPAAAEAKRLVAPPRVEAGRAVPLSAILVLGEAAAPAGHGAATQLLLPHFYRPRAFCVIPGYLDRLSRLTAVAGGVPVLGMPCVEARDEGSWRRAAEEALRLCWRALPSS